MEAKSMLKKCKMYVEWVKYIQRGMKGAGTYYTEEKSLTVGLDVSK